MELFKGQREWVFLIICLGLGLLAEISFLHGQIGISYLVFIIGFYAVVFSRYRFSFNHRRIGLLFTVAIWILSGSYLLYDNDLFYFLNLFIIPILIFSHIVLITSPNSFKWNTPRFLTLLKIKLVDAKDYCKNFFKASIQKNFKHMNDETLQTIKRVMYGLMIGAPLLFIILGLLMSADSHFQEMILTLPEYLFKFNLFEWLFRFAFIFVTGFFLFGIFQVLKVDQTSNLKSNQTSNLASWDRIIGITILILINAVYLLFVIVQFKYFFNGRLVDGFTYAEYARKGFFELIIVTMINLTLLIGFLKFIDRNNKKSKVTLNILYSLLIGASAIMLASAYQRLSMYEAAYGFTMNRALAHAFMIFLIIIFAYTFIHVWIEKISLLHFYLIIGLIFYTVLNVVNIDQIVVDKNIERYEETNKIDFYYLDSLSYTGLNGLITLYESGEDDPELLTILSDRKRWYEEKSNPNWQSYNFTREKVSKRLSELSLKD